MTHREPVADRGISVVIPAFDETEALESAVSGVAATLERMDRGHEILIVNDGLTDVRRKAVEALAEANKRVRVVSHSSREGYGASLRTGFRAAKYPLVLQLDGTNQFDPADIGRLLDVVNPVDIVCGYREPRPSESAGLANWAYRWLLRVVFAVRVHDVDCGFRLFRRSALRRIPIQSNSRFANAEILAKATFMNMLLAEVRVTSRARTTVPAGQPHEARPTLLREAAHVFRRPLFCTPIADTARAEPPVNGA